MNCLETSFSKTLATTGTTDIGLLLHSVLLSPLCMRDMHDTFKSSENMPVSIDLLKITVSDSAIISALSFKSLGDIRSYPVALEVLSFKITFLTSIGQSLLISNFFPRGRYIFQYISPLGKSLSKTEPISLK